jgi:hypothetical protein
MKNDIRGFTYFILLRPGNAYYGFPAYFIDDDGIEHEIVQGIDQYGNKKYRRFSWNKGNRQIRIPNTQQDVIEFLRNYPECEGSPYAGKKKSWFKELNNERDASIALDAKRNRLEAETKALSLEGEELFEVGILCGSVSDKEGLVRHYIAEYAQNNPDGFMEIINDPVRKPRSIVKKGINFGILRKKGFMIFWESIHLGNDIDSATKKLADDPQLLNAIEEAISREGY